MELLELVGGEVVVDAEDLGADEGGEVADFEDGEEVFEGVFLGLVEFEMDFDVADLAEPVVAGGVLFFHCCGVGG